MNCTSIPENATFTSLTEILCDNVPEKIYISAVGCQGIIRRSKERKITLNPHLLKLLLQTAGAMPIVEIEKHFRVQNEADSIVLVEKEVNADVQ